MLVYVLNKNGKALMPCKSQKARILLKSRKAFVSCKDPFTIRLKYNSSGYKQEINLGIDSGNNGFGISATTKKQELLSLEVKNIKDKNKNKLGIHINFIKKIHKILPITKTIVETASFDLNRLKEINKYSFNNKYINRERMDFWNIREFILFRDGHKCYHCKGNSKDEILNIHHRISYKENEKNNPKNLITLCETCHNNYHKGKINLNIIKDVSFDDSITIGKMRWKLYDKLLEFCENVEFTYGYITKNIRIENNLPRGRKYDARCISKNPLAKEGKNYYEYII